LRNVVRSLLQNIDQVKMLYVGLNLRNLVPLLLFFSFFVLISAVLLLSSFYHIMMNKDVY